MTPTTTQPSPLCIIPVYMTGPGDLEVVSTCIKSVYTTEHNADVLVVDDCSPRPDLVDALENMELPFTLHRKEENGGFSRTVNVGLRQARDENRDAILVNADLEFIDPGWIAAFQGTTMDGHLAAVVGARLLYPNGLIQHGGVYFSLLHRCFEHIYKYAPHNLPEAQEARVCPVTGALQFIRADCIQSVGIYDEGFRLGWEDVDYCIRAWKAKLLCVYNPQIRALHYESLFRGRNEGKLGAWQNQSWAYFCEKWGNQSFGEFVPSVL